MEKEENILPGEIQSVPSTEEILKLLECPCCLEPPVPPIKSCATGHIICSFCRPRLTQCCICREPYTDTRNYPLEAIFNGCQIACKFWGRGCDQIVSGGGYIDHVKVCQFRVVCCSHCKEGISPVDKYIDHLKNSHQAVGHEEELENYVCANVISDLYNDFRFPDQYAKFDGRYFIVSAQLRSHFIQIWLNIVENLYLSSDESVTFEIIKKRAGESNYHVVISVSSEDPKIRKVKWTSPIFPLQNGDPDPALVVNIPMHPTFRGFLTTCEDSNDVLKKYSWSFSYEIIKEPSRQ